MCGGGGGVCGVWCVLLVCVGVGVWTVESGTCFGFGGEKQEPLEKGKRVDGPFPARPCGWLFPPLPSTQGHHNRVGCNVWCLRLGKGGVQFRALWPWCLVVLAGVDCLLWWCTSPKKTPIHSSPSVLVAPLSFLAAPRVRRDSLLPPSPRSAWPFLPLAPAPAPITGSVRPFWDTLKGPSCLITGSMRDSASPPRNDGLVLLFLTIVLCRPAHIPRRMPWIYSCTMSGVEEIGRVYRRCSTRRDE